jgi:hypothetical protein
MFRVGHPADHALRIRPELLAKSAVGLDGAGMFPVLRESTPVRMDLSHSGWSDIFFLGMDFPEGARVLNVSIDLAVHGRDATPKPPVEAYLRVIDEPVLRLTSVDLGATAEITDLAEVFDFARDYLGLLKAAVIAAGIVPPGVEGSGENLATLLERVVGPGLGLELVSSVNNIPKGSRLAVSTNLLAGNRVSQGSAASVTGPGLKPATRYYWRVDQIAGGRRVASPVYSFVTDGVLPPVRPVIASVSADGSTFRFRFNSEVGRTYRVERLADLASGVWLPEPGTFDGDGSDLMVDLPMDDPEAALYRVVVE